MSFFSKLFSIKSQSIESSPHTTPLFIIGLGNPGKQYAETRHNFGWLALDTLRTTWHGSEWRSEKKFRAEISETVHAGRKIFFVKPQTFMNNSGETVRALLSFYHATPANIVVLHDEVDIPFGRIKTTESSRAAGHNGVKNIIDRLGTQDFYRLRLGVGKSTNPHISVADHVLQNFSAEEQAQFPILFKEIVRTLEESRV